MRRVPVWLWRWNTPRQWWYLRAARRDRIRRCHDTGHHCPVTRPATPNDLAQGRRHRVVCAICGRRLA